MQAVAIKSELNKSVNFRIQTQISYKYVNTFLEADIALEPQNRPNGKYPATGKEKYL